MPTVLSCDKPNETAETEITVIMFLQRARGAENRAENKSSNGPPRAQSKAAQAAEYSATCGHTSVAGDMLVSCKAYGSCRKSRWYRGF
jgi:hypothetical protein